MIAAEVACFTDKGTVREENEDFASYVIPSDLADLERKGIICAIADGLGGHAAGQVASCTAVKTLLDEYYSPSNSSRVEQALRHAVQTANLHVHDLSQKHLEYRSMGTTLTALALVGSTGFVAHVGDSRLYHLRGSAMNQVTRDHSEVAELVRMRIVKPEMARDHPSRNVLTRTLGHQLMLRPDFSRIPIQPGDVFVQCTDGVWSELTEAEMMEAASTEDIQQGCERLVALCLERACSDNVTVQIIRIQAVGEAPAPSPGGLFGGILNRWGH